MTVPAIIPQLATKQQQVQAVENTISILIALHQQFLQAQMMGPAAITTFYDGTLSQQQTAPKPTYSIDGESMDWAGWSRLMMESIDKYLELKQKLSQPWILRSPGRAGYGYRGGRC